MKKFIILASFVFATIGFSSITFAGGPNTIQIINGQPAGQHALATSVVGMFVKYNEPFSELNGVWLQWCTGSVLGPKLILTAAHCVKDVKASDIKINFSGKTVTTDNQINPQTRIADPSQIFTTRNVKALEIHPQYDGSGTHDLAILALETEVPTTAKPVQFLPSTYFDSNKNETSFEGQSKSITLLGFGLISESPSTDTEVLRSTVVQAEFIKNLVVTDQTHGSGGCNGDSGGPAFFELNAVTYQVGVTHGPHGNSTTCHETGEWVNPALDADFIASAIKKLNP